MKKLRIAVVGGSACSSAGLDSSSKAWPLLLRDSYHCDLQYVSLGGLTIVRAIQIISEIEPCDLVILNLGTSTGWPIPITKLQDRFGIKFSSEFGFHQPIKKTDVPTLFKIRKLIKLRFKNSVKYLLFAFGLYRPKAGIHEINDQIDVLAKVLKSKTRNTVWLQHRVFQKTSTRVERYFYQRYYNKILNKVESLEDESISVLQIPDTFVIQSNYLSDWVHLSHDGHTKMSKLVSEHIDDILEINHEERRA